MGRKPSEAKREAILAAAIEEFHERGFAGTSMDRIADRANVSKRTVYNHFESKENLFFAFLGSFFEEGFKECAPPYDPDRPIREQIREMVLLDIKSHEDEEAMATARILISDVVRNPDLAEALFNQVRSFKEEAATWFKSASDAGALDIDDPEVAGKTLMSMVHGFFFWPQMFLREDVPTGDERARVVENILDTFLARYENK